MIYFVFGKIAKLTVIYIRCTGHFICCWKLFSNPHKYDSFVKNL